MRILKYTTLFSHKTPCPHTASKPFFPKSSFFGTSRKHAYIAPSVQGVYLGDEIGWILQLWCWVLPLPHDLGYQAKYEVQNLGFTKPCVIACMSLCLLERTTYTRHTRTARLMRTTVCCKFHNSALSPRVWQYECLSTWLGLTYSSSLAPICSMKHTSTTNAHFRYCPVSCMRFISGDLWTRSINAVYSCRCKYWKRKRNEKVIRTILRDPAKWPRQIGLMD